MVGSCNEMAFKVICAIYARNEYICVSRRSPAEIMQRLPNTCSSEWNNEQNDRNNLEKKIQRVVK